MVLMEKCFETKKPKREEQNSCVVVPSDIIAYDILTRVPPESLVRFRCVCKSWSNLCDDDPLFIKLHSQRYDNKSYSSGFIHTEWERDPISHEFMYSLVFVNHNDKKKRIMPCIPFRSPDKCLINSDVYIMHSVSMNGLLLLRCYHDCSYKFYVYTPITRCSTIIPIPINDVQPGRECFCQFRLCYDPLIEKHKVVFCGPYKTSQSKSSPYPPRKIKILTVGDGVGGKGEDEDDSWRWRDIIVPDTFHLYNLHSFDAMFYSTACHNEFLYRMVNPRYILRLDASRELYEEIKLPEEVSALNLKCDLHEMDGLLCLSHYTSGTHELKVWTLKKKDYNCDEDENEWVELRFNINTKENMHLQLLAIITVPKMKLIVAHNSRDRYRINNNTYTYYSYDIELETLEIIHGPRSTPAHWHVNSFANC